ncbi:MAG: indole-3-glycerol phosphate synthase TrpC [Acidobacteriota bacterium]
MIDTLLHEIVSFKEASLHASMKIRPEKVLFKMIQQNDPALPLKLDDRGLSIIAEIKPASPVLGTLRLDPRPAELALSYKEGGASAVSVLTEERFFKGSPAMLMQAKEAVGIPVMRKDFIFHPYQVIESRAIAADGILLIVRILKDHELKILLKMARSFGMFVLAEAFEEIDIERIVDAGADIIGINARDLKDFSVKFERLAALSEKIPDDRVKIAESGIRTIQDIRAIRELKFQGVLIGEALMRTDNPASLIRKFKEAGRRC